MVVPGAAWICAAVLCGAPATAAWATAATSAIVAVLATATALRGWHGGGPALLAVGAVVVAAVAMSAAARTGAMHRAPWPLWGEQRATIGVTLQLSETPRQETSQPWVDAGAETSQSARAIVATAVEQGGAAGDAAWRLRTPVWVLIPGNVSETRLRAGDEIRGTARVAPGDQRAGILARVTVLTVDSVTPSAGWAGRVEAAARAAMARLPSDEGALVRGLAFGEDADLSTQAVADTRSAGLGHLTAVSGANIAMVVAVAMGAARLVGAPRSVAVVPGAVALGGYVWLVGAEPSVLRAAAMAIVALVAVLVGGGSGVAALASAVSVLLVWDPGLAVSRGFALSCAATGGLIGAAGPARRWLARVTSGLPVGLAAPAAAVVAALTTAIAAAAATAPLLASYGEGGSWAGVLANVAVSPVVPLVPLAGLAVTGLALVWPAAAASLAAVPGWGASWILTVARATSGMPGGRVELPGSWQSGAMVAAVLGAAWLLSRRWPRAPAALALASVATAVGSARMPPALGGVPSGWAAVFCDVGQGDATLLRSGPRSAVVVDAGPEPDAALDCLRRTGITEVDAVVLSHFHRDHVEGYPAVASAQGPVNVWVSPLAEPRPQMVEVRDAAALAGSTMQVPAVGTTDSWGAVRAEVLAPVRAIDAGSPPNNASLVVVAEVAAPQGTVRVLLAGDIEPEAQAALMDGVSNPHVDVAKVPHHGSGNQHPRFAAWTGARWAVISCGEGNDYGHPAESTVRGWQGVGATTVRTDRQGDVYVSVDAAGQVVVHTSKASR